ncbi:hypothetical protein ACKVWC_011559 [Pyricularia oryzae]
MADEPTRLSSSDWAYLRNPSRWHGLAQSTRPSSLPPPRMHPFWTTNPTLKRSTRFALRQDTVETCLAVPATASLSKSTVANQTSDLDALPTVQMCGARILKRRVQSPPRHACGVRVEALYEQHVLWRHAPLVVPAMLRVVANHPLLPLKVVLDHDGLDQVLVWNRGRVRHRDWVLAYCLYGPPDVDDLVAPLDQLVGLVGELPPQPELGAVVRLVDVRLCDGPAVLEVL